MDAISPETQKVGSWAAGILGTIFGVVAKVKAGRKEKREAVAVQITTALAPLVVLVETIREDVKEMRAEMCDLGNDVSDLREDLAETHGFIAGGRRDGDPIVRATARQRRNARLTTS